MGGGASDYPYMDLQTHITSPNSCNPYMVGNAAALTPTIAE
jgi:hypothetical protein